MPSLVRAPVVQYLQPFPFWSQLIAVPVFSVLSSFNNLQPLRSWDLVVIVVISCISFAAQNTAIHVIFNGLDVVSVKGAFVVGLLWNVYSRQFGGAAFAAMVVDVLFLVPVRCYYYLRSGRVILLWCSQGFSKLEDSCVRTPAAVLTSTVP